MNILTDKLPETVIIDGAEYQINTDFRISVQFEMLMQSDMPNDEKIKTALQLYYPIIPQNINKAVDKIIEFYSGVSDKSAKKRGKSGNSAVYSFRHDMGYIYSAFMQVYNIDLTAINLHWYKFIALFKSLPENCEFSKIIGYRAIQITADMPKKQREYYQKMKKLYALPLSDNDKKLQNELENALLNGGDINAIIERYKE